MLSEFLSMARMTILGELMSLWRPDTKLLHMIRRYSIVSNEQAKPVERRRGSPQEHIYHKYVSSGASGPKLTSVQDLTPRLPYLRRIVKQLIPQDRQIAILRPWLWKWCNAVYANSTRILQRFGS